MAKAVCRKFCDALCGQFSHCLVVVALVQGALASAAVGA